LGEKAMTSKVRICTPGEAQAALASGNECQLVDVREFSEYETERVAGATLVPLSQFEQHADQIDRARPVYVMCRSGKRAAQAAERLAQKGFRDLRVIDGGLQAWSAAGYAVESGARRVWSLERQVRFVAGLFVFAGVVLSLLVHPWFVALSAFVGAGLVFAAVTDTCGMGMMLARMPWNRAPQKAAGQNSNGAVCSR